MNWKLQLDLIRRWIALGGESNKETCLEFKVRVFLLLYMLSGSSVYGGRSLKGGISQHLIRPIPLSHLRPCIPVHTLTVCMYSTSSMLILTQVPTNFLVCCTSLIVPSWSCVNILPECQKNVSGMKRGWSCTAQQPSAPILMYCKIFRLQVNWQLCVFAKSHLERKCKGLKMISVMMMVAEFHFFKT